MRRTISFGALCALLVLGGCGDESSAPSEPADMTGTWTSNGRFDDGFGFVFVLTLTQTGTDVTGTAQMLNIATGTVAGTVTGNRFNFQMTLPPQCPGTLTGSATVSGRNINGSLSGSTQCFGSTQATYQGLRQGSQD